MPLAGPLAGSSRIVRIAVSICLLCARTSVYLSVLFYEAQARVMSTSSENKTDGTGDVVTSLDDLGRLLTTSGKGTATSVRFDALGLDQSEQLQQEHERKVRAKGYVATCFGAERGWFSELATPLALKRLSRPDRYRWHLSCPTQTIALTVEKPSATMVVECLGPGSSQVPAGYELWLKLDWPSLLPLPTSIDVGQVKVPDESGNAVDAAAALVAEDHHQQYDRDLDNRILYNADKCLRARVQVTRIESLTLEPFVDSDTEDENETDDDDDDDDKVASSVGDPTSTSVSAVAAAESKDAAVVGLVPIVARRPEVYALEKDPFVSKDLRLVRMRPRSKYVLLGAIGASDIPAGTTASWLVTVTASFPAAWKADADCSKRSIGWMRAMNDDCGSSWAIVEARPPRSRE